MFRFFLSLPSTAVFAICTAAVMQRGAPAQDQWCDVPGPGLVCGVKVDISPFVSGGGPFGGFQSMAGTSYQRDIVVTFDPPVKKVSATILDPDYVGNTMIAFAGQIGVDSANFAGDNAPGMLTRDTRTVSYDCGITRVILRPEKLDFVAYTDLRFFR